IRLPQENWPAQICERPIIVGRSSKRAIALIADPESAKTVLTGSADKFPRWRIYQHVVGRGAGRESLSAADGGPWRRLRKAFSPMFRPEHLSQLMPQFQRATARAAVTWRAQGDAASVDISLEMTRLTLHIIWRLLLGDSMLSLVDRVAAEIHAASL